MVDLLLTWCEEQSVAEGVAGQSWTSLHQFESFPADSPALSRGAQSCPRILEDGNNNPTVSVKAEHVCEGRAVAQVWLNKYQVSVYRESDVSVSFSSVRLQTAAGRQNRNKFYVSHEPRVETQILERRPLPVCKKNNPLTRDFFFFSSFSMQCRIHPIISKPLTQPSAPRRV